MANWALFFSNLGSLVRFFMENWFLGKPKWRLEDMPDMTGKVVIVTGGTAGLGLDSVRGLLKANAKVYIAARNETKANQLIKQLLQETGQKAYFLKLDLEDLRSVKSAAEEYLRKESRLDVLFNNAGVFSLPIGPDVDGYDMVFHTNVIGPFYLSKLLLPVLKHTTALRVKEAEADKVKLGNAKANGKVNGNGDANGSHNGHAIGTDGEAIPAHLYTRIVNLSSSVNHFAARPCLDFSTFKGSGRLKQPMEMSYIQSKLAAIVVSKEFSKRYRKDGVLTMAVNPGSYMTDMMQSVKEMDPVTYYFNKYFIFIYPLKWGCITQLWAGVAPEAAKLDGKYIVPWGKEGTPRPETDDPALGRDLWLWLEEQIDAFENRD